MFTTTRYQVQTMKHGHGRFVTQSETKSLDEARLNRRHYDRQDDLVAVRITKTVTTIETVED